MKKTKREPKGKRAKKSYLVFISHSKHDRWIARQIARLIEERGRGLGVVTFLDEKDIKAGDPIREEIRKNLQECNEFLVLLSQYSIGSDWVLAEIGGAWTLEKRIVTITNQLQPEDLPEVITPYLCVDLNNFDQYVDQLLERVREVGK